jgi:hypothetical protein
VFWVPNVASVTGLSILDCPFGFLKRVFTICDNYNPSFLNSWYIMGFVVRVTRRVPRVEQEQLTLPEHMRTPLVFNGVRVVQNQPTINQPIFVLLILFCESGLKNI